MPQTKTAAPVLQHRNGQTKKIHHLYFTLHQPHLQGFRQSHANGLRAGRAVRRGRIGPGRRGGILGLAGLACCLLGGWAAITLREVATCEES